jgi:hypothetical protein
MKIMSNLEYQKYGDDIGLKEVLLMLPKIEKNRVSIKARGENGFLNKFIAADGDLLKMSDEMLTKRLAFLQRTVPAYVKKPTFRRMLSLYAWGWKPNVVAEEPVKQKRGRKSL